MSRRAEAWADPADVAAELLLRRRGGDALLALDFDGTLVPLRDRPDEVRLDEAGRDLLRRIARGKGLHVAVVSGRALADVQARLGVPGIACAGNHGAEVRLWEGPVRDAAGPAEREVARRLYASLARAAAGLAGVWVEDKGPVLTVHHRAANALARAELEARLAAEKPRFPSGARERIGRDVREYFSGTLPRKADAIRLLAAEAGVGDPRCWAVLGDDETDEEAFRELGPEALTIRVGPTEVPTAALRRLAGPTEVREFLARLAAGCAPDASEEGP